MQPPMRCLILPLLVLVGIASAATASNRPDAVRPNVVLIVTDNHGAWTLGCYGNPDIKTPNLDQMAEDGVRFTKAFSNNPVCSLTRATLLSGLMPSQHGVHNYLSARYNRFRGQRMANPPASCSI